MADLPVVPGRFAGRTAIVTGAGSGIGRATTVRLAREGARVVAADVSGERLDALVAEFPDLDLVPVVGDITAEDGVAAVVAAAGERVDVLANVAGIMDAFLPPSEVDDATWDRVFAVNLTAPMRLVRAVLPVMTTAGKGAIVNVSSEASLRASASGVAYTASKHAVNGLTKSIAFFHGPQGIRANAVAPGAVIRNIEAPMRSELAARSPRPPGAPAATTPATLSPRPPPPGPALRSPTATSALATARVRASTGSRPSAALWACRPPSPLTVPAAPSGTPPTASRLRGPG